MYVIYCLKNESFKDNILCIGITLISDCVQSGIYPNLIKILDNMNKSFLPTPYTILITKTVNNYNCIEVLYDLLCKFGKQINDTLLCKFGKQINGTFFEISPKIVKQLFELIQDQYYNTQENIYENTISNENISVIQNKIEYIIPIIQEHNEVIYSTPNISDDFIYSTLNISDTFNEIDLYYDTISSVKDYGDIDL